MESEAEAEAEDLLLAVWDAGGAGDCRCPN